VIISEVLDYSNALIIELKGGGDLLNRLPAVSEAAPMRHGSASFPHLDLKKRSEQQILACEEALLAACEFVGPGARRYPWSVYAVVRACLEGAATLYWTLSPRSSEERLGRLCLLELDDLKHEMAYVNRLEGTTKVQLLKRLQERKTELTKSAEILGVRNQITAGRTVTARLREFDRMVGSENRDDFLQSWSVCCAAIHGSTWGMRVLSKALPESDEGTSELVQNETLAVLQVALAATALRHSHRLYSTLSGTDISGRIPNPSHLVSKAEMESAA
jgi:hypothetical protein